MHVSRDGLSLHVDVDGPEGAPAVAFLHGVTASGRSYGWLPPEITDGRRILRIDLRGHGRSGHAPGSYTLDAYAEDVAHVLRELAGGPAVVAGHSLGGCIAWTLAQREPDLVRAAFLEDPPLYYSEDAEFAGSAARRAFPILHAWATEWQAQGADPATISRRMGDQPFGPDRSRRVRDVLTEDALVAVGHNLHDLDPGVIQGAAENTTLHGIDLTSPVTVPVLLLAGCESMGGVVAERHIARLAQTHPDVEVVVVDGAGHQISASREHRRTYVRHLARFVGEHAPA